MLLALGSVSIASADQYYYGGQGYCPNCPQGNGYSQDGYYQDGYYQGGYYQNQPYQNYYYQGQNQQTYYQRDDRNYQQQNQSTNSNQQYYQQQGKQQQQYYAYGTQNRDNQKSVSDQDIKAKIQDSLNGGWFAQGFNNVSFEINNGNVTLRGTVDSMDNKNKIEENVKKMDGVKQVNNQITVAKDNTNQKSY